MMHNKSLSKSPSVQAPPLFNPPPPTTTTTRGRVARKSNWNWNWLLRFLFGSLIGAYVGLIATTTTTTTTAGIATEQEMEWLRLVKNQTTTSSTTATASSTTATIHDFSSASTSLPAKQQPPLQSVSGKASEIKAATTKKDRSVMRRTNNKSRDQTTKRRAIIQKNRQNDRKKLQQILDPDFADPVTMHRQLYDFYNIQHNNSSTSPTNLWDDDPNSKLPDWMKRYLTWHKEQQKTFRRKPADGVSLSLSLEDYASNSSKQQRFLVMQCVHQDANCGGISDRLKPLPWAIRVAYYTKRILLIHWNKPGLLEDFLVPPAGGLNWRAPDWMIHSALNNRSFGVLAIPDAAIRAAAKTNVTLVRSRYQAYHSGMWWYDAQLIDGEPKFAQVFHDVWKLTFTPSRPVRDRIESEMQKMNLTPYTYTAAHLRALYGMKDRDEFIKRAWARNALNCASETRPRTPIFFASDSANATYYAKMYAARHNATLATRIPHPNPPLHLDKVPNWRKRPLSDFYDAFVDLYILAQADCVTYNKGGYGIMGLYMSRNSACGVRQDAMDRPKINKPCRWVDDPANDTQVTRDSRQEKVVSTELVYHLESMKY